MPTYDFDEFKIACGNVNQVFVTPNAMEDADRCFNLKTQRRLLEFINNDGLEMLTHYNSKPLEKNFSSDTPIIVDAYTFKTGGIRGYIAFYYSAKTKKWIIKSFKFDKDSNQLMAQAFKKAGFCIPWEAGEDDGEKK